MNIVYLLSNRKYPKKFKTIERIGKLTKQTTFVFSISFCFNGTILTIAFETKKIVEAATCDHFAFYLNRSDNIN
jgi:hypothetical protein